MFRFIGWLLCQADMHSMQCGTTFHPSIDAPIVTKVVWTARCRRCGLTRRDVQEFDPITGAPMEKP